MSLFSDINSRMRGRVALLSDAEAEALVKIVSIPGDYIDLGTLWGGTAILAALAKKRNNIPGMIYTVDFMQGGYWVTGDPSMGFQRPTEQAIHDNLDTFNVADRVVVVKAPTNPWPLMPDVLPSSVLIDCDHSFEGCTIDWLKVRSLRPRFIAFHDFNAKTHPGVTEVVDKIIKTDKVYQFYEQAGTMIVFEQVSQPKQTKPKTRAQLRV